MVLHEAHWQEDPHLHDAPQQFFLGLFSLAAVSFLTTLGDFVEQHMKKSGVLLNGFVLIHFLIYHCG